MGLLKDKARILATHQLWVLNRCDRIIWMEDGKIQAIDTFDNLMKDHAGFQILMETTAVEEKHVEEGHVNDDEVEDEKKVQKKKKKASGLMQAEERAVKSVPWSVYIDYIKASGSLLNAPIVLGFLLASQGANIATSLWLSWWTSNSKSHVICVPGNMLTLTRIRVFQRSLYRCLRSTWSCPGSATLLLCTFPHNHGHKCEQKDVKSGSHPSTQSTNVVLRYHTSRSNHESFLPGCRCHG